MSAYLHDATGAPYNAETFDLDAYLRRIPEEFLLTPAARREVTRDDPLLWACVYVPHLLRTPEGTITFGDVHLQLYRDALELTETAGPGESRRAYVAPRGSGKSTTLFVITTLYLACHHPMFIAAFSSSATQAMDHLAAVRLELNTNKLLRLDFPETCTPVKKPSGRPVADSDSMLYTESGFCFSARGIDTEVLGLVDPLNRRPQAIWLDDIESEESQYSAYQAGKRLTTILDGILPMNDRAHVRLIGTVTMPGSIMHQLVKTVLTTEEPAKWIAAANFQVTYFPPLVLREDGTERSVWPGRWSAEYFQSIRHTPSFAKNYANDPMGRDGKYWSRDDFRYGTIDTVTKTLLSIDPAVTAKQSSDYTGLAVVGYSPVEKRCIIKHSAGVRLIGKDLRDHVIGLLERFPEIRVVRVEANQAGDLWHTVLHDLPGVKVITHTSTASKEVRFAQALDWWQRGRVLHTQPMPALEEQAVGFPEAAFDDVIDAAVAGVTFFLQPKPTIPADTVRSYV